MYGLIGNPLGHSFSADFFNDKFEREGINERYELFPLPEIDRLPDLLKAHPDLKGLNVTIPYKEKVISYLTALSDDARVIGAVNVIKISDNGKKLTGYNSDAIGFRDTIQPLIKPYMRKALVLGTGGASRAVAYVLRNLGLEVTKVSRHPEEGELSYDGLTPEVMESSHVIVNTTPLGMWPNTDQAPPLPYHLLTPEHLCYDLVYNPEVTKFMALSEKQGAAVKNGLDMLHGQALAAWRIWTEG